jgi:hypothetical protein
MKIPAFISRVTFGIFFFCIFLVGKAPFALADHTGYFQGSGMVKHSLEQVQVTINVNAKCYKSPLSAYEAADQVVADVIRLLEPKIQPGNPNDRVIHVGISTSEYVAYNPGTSARICEGTYQAESTIILKTSEISDFGRIFAAIQQDVLSLARPSVDPTKESLSVSVQTPVKLLYPETLRVLELQAVQKAKLNAVKKFEAACPGTQYQIIAISDPILKVRTDERASMPTPIVGGDPSPIYFNELQMTYELFVKFSYFGTCLGFLS